MSEIAIFVETVAGAAWLIFGAVGILALGFLAFDRRPERRSRSREAAHPGEQRAA